MALTGHLSDLSLSELIEFFCNQRKAGRLKVLYPQGPGYFYLQTGSVVDARIGVLRGIDAVYYALTLPNAKFEFSGTVEATDRTINQPWTQVVLEGLRRLDEGIVPSEAFPVGYQVHENEEPEAGVDTAPYPVVHRSHVPAFLSFIGKESMANQKPLIAGAVVVAVISCVAAIGVPAGWYNRVKVSLAASEPAVAPSSEAQPPAPGAPEVSTAKSSETAGSAEDTAGFAARRQRERERARARAAQAALANQTSVNSVSPTTPSAFEAGKGPKRVAVTVTYDESGRVTQASGGDPSAIRIARQKRFPPGKAGSATVTIPIN